MPPRVLLFRHRQHVAPAGKSPGSDSSSRATAKNNQVVFLGIRFPPWLVCGSVLHRAHILSFLECRSIRSLATALRLHLWSYARLTTRPRACLPTLSTRPATISPPPATPRPCAETAQAFPKAQQTRR